MNALCKRLAAMGTVFLSACQMLSAQAVQPAVLSNPGPEVQQELAQVVAELSGFASVSLAATDLTRSSTLVIQRKPQTDGAGELLQGRDLEMPQRFQLVLQGGQCWLQQLQPGGQRRLLTKALCRPEAPTE
jgi:hypothetical protein